MILCVFLVQLNLPFYLDNYSSFGSLCELKTDNTFKKIKTVVGFLVGPSNTFWSWLSFCCEFFFLSIKHLVVVEVKFRLLIMFRLLDACFRLMILADLRFQRMVHTQCLLWDDTLKNKTVVPVAVMPGFALEAFLLVDQFLFYRLGLFTSITFTSRTINFTLTISIYINCCWSDHNEMFFLDDLLECSSPNEDPLGDSYIFNADRALTLMNSKVRISKPKLGSVFYCCFEYRKKLSDSVWVRVASIWGVSRYISGATICLMFEATFARSFAPIFFMEAFPRLGLIVLIGLLGVVTLIPLLFLL
jgi:hypothetical protein